MALSLKSIEELNVEKQNMQSKLEDLNERITYQKKTKTERGFIPPHVGQHILENYQKEKKEIVNKIIEIEKLMIIDELKDMPSIVAEIIQSSDRNDHFESKYVIGNPGNPDCIINVRRYSGGNGTYAAVIGLHVRMTLTIDNYQFSLWCSVFKEDIFYAMADLQYNSQSNTRIYNQYDDFEFEQIDESFNINVFKKKMNECMPQESAIYIMNYLIKFSERKSNHLILSM